MRGEKVRAVRKAGRDRSRCRRPLRLGELLESRLLLSAFIVNVTSEFAYPQPYPATPDLTAPMGLGDAINFANKNPGTDTIVFNIPPAGAQTISLTSALPSISSPMTIDGTTQPGYVSGPLIGITGANDTAQNTAALTVLSSDVTIKGLAIFGFAKADGIKISANRVTVQGCYIGVDQSGTTAFPNNVGIDIVSGQNIQIGGSSLSFANQSNVISGNSGYGIEVGSGAFDTPTALNNTIQGNFIGTDITGQTAIPNGSDGIYLHESPRNLIGGDRPGQGNVVSGNGGIGIELDGFFTQATGNRIQGNMIGVSGDGTKPLGNKGDGIYFGWAGTSMVGGTTRGAANVIGANGGDGIGILSGQNNIIQGNYIGTNPAGATNLGNVGNGIGLANFDESGTQIGGALAGAGNVIAYNAKVGVLVDFSSTPSTNVPILSNSIHDNGGLGIDLAGILGGDGPTPNDQNDYDTGVNNLQNFPVITSAATAAGRTQVIGTFNSTPGTTFLLQFFASPAADPSTYGEGADLLGSTAVTTDGAGNAQFHLTLDQPSSVGYSVSATATRVGDSGYSDTSEFSQSVPLTQGQVTDLVVKLDGPTVATAGTDLHTFQPQVVKWGDGSSVPSTGTGLVVVGIDNNNLLHVRVFDSTGFLVTDTDESKLPASDASAVSALKQEVTGLLPLNSLTTAQKTKLLTDVSLLVEPYATYTATVTNNGPDDATNVQVFMTLPGGYVPDINDPDSISSSQGTAVLSTGQVIGNLGTIAAGKSATVTFSILPTASGSITTTATAQDDQIDPNPANSSDSVTTQVYVPADLSMTIVPEKDPAISGKNAAFRVLVTNHGPGPATGVKLHLTLPANATFVAASSGQGSVPAPLGTDLVMDLGSLSRGVSGAVRIVLTPTDANPLALSGSLSFDQIDLNTLDNSGSKTVTVVNGTDLSVSLAPTQPAGLSGQPVTFVATVRNLGPNPADGVVLTFPVPANSTFVSSSPAGQLIDNGTKVQVNLGSLGPGNPVEVHFTVTPSASGTLSASVSADPTKTGDTDPDNNQATAQALVGAGDLGISQSASASFARVGQPLTYSLAVTNSGPADATGVTVYDHLPDSVRFVSGSAGNGGSVHYDPNTHVVTITIGSLGANTAVPVSLKVVPAVSTTLTNSAAVEGAQQDQDSTNNTTTLATDASPADLAASVSASPGHVVAGNTVTFTAVVTNKGPAAASGVQFSQSLPANVQFVSAHASQGSVSLNNGQISGNLGGLGPNGSATVTLVVIPLSSGTATSTASVSSDMIDRDPRNNQGSASVNVSNQPGTIQIASELYQADENSGYAAITLTRTNGTQGSVSVAYSTDADGTAKPGINFSPVSQTVTFKDGETSKTIFVPVQSDGTYEPYTYLHVTLSDPTGGVNINGRSSTILAVMNTDIDSTPLVVANTTLIASGPVINGVQLTFNKALNPALASSPGNFFLIGPDGVGIPTYPPIYNGLNHTVTVVPAAPLTAPGFYTVVVNGAANGLTDYHGTVLDGNGDGIAGGNFIESFARGASLIYGDATGNIVSLSLNRGGLLEMFRDASGNATELNVFAPPAGRSVLSGSVVRFAPSATGSTSLGHVSGLGLGGPVRSALTTPPFYVTSQANNGMAMATGLPRSPIVANRFARVHLPRWFLRHRGL